MPPVRTTLCLAAVCALALPVSAAAAGPTRYSLQGGCFALQDGSGKVIADQIRMQATDLGSYMLYTKDRKFLSGTALTPADAPSPDADFVVEGPTGSAFTISPKSSPGQKLTVRFVAAQGCADFPEAPLNATGTVKKNPLSYGKVGGIVEGHMHWMTFEYF